ncbi:DUF58 domain-containing protein [Desulfofundulus thermosubterraneus]|uniref:DUF58 domain-containing protein n=1 Tax=Desulfofundulus thermosubterraneus DSM 16057 TaxID=1121432 RepID=A0A1M6ALT1_9FIRM|nr:DUF58 domain-containing protein [Desulfofundulus thermosubterraneus]SHI37450.1 Protein of unknown function DUF58 [Desulfofundulus thermosubterraneus DSM 16057]
MKFQNPIQNPDPAPGRYLLEPGLAARLEGYRLVRYHPVGGEPGGSRRSRRKGGAVEFADYRQYTPGDEPRRVDWKAYARLGRLYVKEFLDERQDCVLLLVDTSASMDYGGEAHKGRCALRVAAGLGVCTLAGNDRLAAAAGGSQTALLAPLGGRGSIFRLLQFLEGLTFGGVSDLAGDLRAALAMAPRTGSLYVFSDLLDLEKVEKTLRLAAGYGLETTLLHIMAPQEQQPGLEGEWALVDAESGARVEVSVTPALLLAYRRRLKNFMEQLDDLCRRWGARRVMVDSGERPGSTFFITLPRAGVLHPR